MNYVTSSLNSAIHDFYGILLLQCFSTISCIILEIQTKARVLNNINDNHLLQTAFSVLSVNTVVKSIYK